MADFGLFIGFGAPVRGRERQAIEGFTEVFEYNSRLQQDGEICCGQPPSVCATDGGRRQQNERRPAETAVRGGV